MQFQYIAKLFIAFLVITPTLFAQAAEPTAKLPAIQRYNPFRVQGGGAFDRHLFQADALLRLGDSITTHRTVFDGTGRFSEADPIAPGENHSVALVYIYQLSAHVAIIQGHNLLVRHHHAKLARALVVADVVMEAYTVGQNVRHEMQATPVSGTTAFPVAAIESKPVYR